MRVPAIVLSAALLFATTAFAQGPPLQADLSVPMPIGPGSATHARSVLDGGNARVAVRATNPRSHGDTVRVTLRFRYSIPPDTIALDEIISRIVVETVGPATEVFGTATIDPNEVSLNPNRVPLVYQVTLYRTEMTDEVRVRVFGNYE